MKKNTWLIGNLWLGLLWSVAVRSEVIELSVPVPQPRTFVDAQGFTHVELDGYYHAGTPGSPSLPSRSVLVAIPPGQEVESVHLLPAENVPLPGNHVVFPVQKEYPRSYTGPRPFTGPDLAWYQAQREIPGTFGNRKTQQHKRGVSLLPILLTPVQYHPASGALSYTPKIAITVVTSPCKSGNGVSRMYRGLVRDLAAVQPLVINPEILGSVQLRTPSKQAEDARYLIITSQSLAQCQGEYTLETLVRDKNARGITTQIQTMEAIRQRATGIDDAEKVRNFILDRYQNAGTDYVLLAGDADLAVVGGETEAPIVPVRGLWGDIDYGGPELNIPSDLYYACLDGTFDSDGDGIYGEEHDEVDALAEVLVGRVPADSCAELSNFVRKTLAYQNSTSENLNKVLLAGEWLGPGVFGNETLELVRTGTRQNGLSTRGFVDSDFFEVNTLYATSEQGPGCWEGPEILALLNQEVHVLNHLGHSMTDYNLRLTTDALDAGLTNTEPFFEFTGGCYPGSFDNRLDPVFGNNQVIPQDSFVEHLLLGEHGAFAAHMFTRYGAGDLIFRLFWDATFGHGITRLAEMNSFAQGTASAWISDRLVRWQIFGENFFGDPEVALHMSNQTRPLLGVHPDPLVFIAVLGQPIQTQTILVRNDGGGNLEWTIQSDQPWLSATPSAGTAPREVTISVDTSGLAAGTYQGALQLSAPGAANSPQEIQVDLYAVVLPEIQAGYTFSAPVVDGAIRSGEYENAGFMDIGFVAAGRSTGKIVHDGNSLYMSFAIADDATADPLDTLILVVDNNGDDQWPSAPGDEGYYYLQGDGASAFLPLYSSGGSIQVGETENNPSGIQTVFGSGIGQRIIEISFDLTQSHFKFTPGATFGLLLYYYDMPSQDSYQLVGMWPAAVSDLDQVNLFGHVLVQAEPDRLVIDPGSLSFEAISGTDPTEPLSLAISATTAQDIDFTAVASDPWILLSADTGKTPATITVRADPKTLNPGQWTGNITILAPQAKNSPQQISVILVVTEASPVFDIQPTALTFEMTLEDPAATASLPLEDRVPAPQALSINNAGGGLLDWIAMPAGDWFELDRVNGQAPGAVEIRVKPKELPAGQYTGIILFTAPGATPLPVTLTLKVISSKPLDTPKDNSGCATVIAAPGRAQIWSLLLWFTIGGMLRGCRRRR